jgi:hypothetical protein
MEAIIKTTDKKIFQKIMHYLRSLGVSVYTKTETPSLGGKFKSEREFEEMAGLWKDRNTTLESLRSKAWPGRKW